ncbi:hypothetical protein HJ590_14895 [Naumannella sp. ID2617S]|uniref:hypothetical protein n=1 Tax=Enemella dayhoffiae TaxID=2016507 RepID=UPI00113FFC76|nr:hypothetical protein [Enemella dayhoffiae]NNG20826.1 hypothetical protein [Naumannella sp. ID2617S]
MSELSHTLDRLGEIGRQNIQQPGTPTGFAQFPDRRGSGTITRCGCRFGDFRAASDEMVEVAAVERSHLGRDVRSDGVRGH